MTTKLQSPQWNYWQQNFMREIAKMPIGQDPSLDALNKLYRPINRRTPMASAILAADLDKIRRLISQGWNAYIEINFFSLGDEGFYHSIDRLNHLDDSYRRHPNYHQFIPIMALLIQSKTTGVSLEKEFERLISTQRGRFNPDRAIDLLDMGITKESYLQATDFSLFAFAYWHLSFYDGDRDLPDCRDFLKYLKERFASSIHEVREQIDSNGLLLSGKGL